MDKTISIKFETEYNVKNAINTKTKLSKKVENKEIKNVDGKRKMKRLGNKIRWAHKILRTDLPGAGQPESQKVLNQGV